MKYATLLMLICFGSVFADGEDLRSMYVKVIVTPGKRDDLAEFKYLILASCIQLIDDEIKAHDCTRAEAKERVDKVLALDFASSCGCACGVGGTGIAYLRNAIAYAKKSCGVRVLSHEKTPSCERVVLTNVESFFSGAKDMAFCAQQGESPHSGGASPVSMVPALSAATLVSARVIPHKKCTLSVEIPVR